MQQGKTHKKIRKTKINLKLLPQLDCLLWRSPPARCGGNCISTGLNQRFSYGHNSKNDPHLQFANDTILFRLAEWEEIATLKRILRCFSVNLSIQDQSPEEYFGRSGVLYSQAYSYSEFGFTYSEFVESCYRKVCKEAMYEEEAIPISWR